MVLTNASLYILYPKSGIRGENMFWQPDKFRDCISQKKPNSLGFGNSIKCSYACASYILVLASALRTASYILVAANASIFRLLNISELLIAQIYFYQLHLEESNLGFGNCSNSYLQQPSGWSSSLLLKVLGCNCSLTHY